MLTGSNQDRREKKSKVFEILIRNGKTIIEDMIDKAFPQRKNHQERLERIEVKSEVYPKKRGVFL